jgi:[protein-PII] uridylyltransferase
MTASGAAQRLTDDLRALDRAYSPGHHGRWSAERRSDLVDQRLHELFAAAHPPGGVVLVALGGYGRRELAPASDVDLLVLHEHVEADVLAQVVDRLLYPLWDTGVAVGHAVRTPDEAAAMGEERLDALTAMLDGRALAGDEDVWQATRSRMIALVSGERARAFAERLREDADRRAARHGAVSYLLEPDLKEGRGGLRDAHSLRWLSFAVTGRPDGLVAAGLLRAGERTGVDDASEFLVRVRSAVHLETGRAGDRLLMDLQPSIARALGFEDEPDLRAVDALMRNVFEHARLIEHVAGSAFDRLLRGGSEAAAVHPTPAGVLRTFADTAGRRGVPSPATLDAVERVDVPKAVEWTDEVRAAFLDLLGTGVEGVRALETLDRLGLLERYLPAWAAVRCLPQRDPYHRYSVDVHLLRALESMSALLSGADDDPIAAEAATLVTDRSALLLGALFHDIGKTGRGSHVPVGAAIVAGALAEMHIPEATAELVRFLVSEHLLLSDTATRRDLDDDDLILDVAGRVGSQERLAALYLLTRADAAATGPAAWTAWRATLVHELVGKLQRTLERGGMGTEVAERLAARADELREIVPEEHAAEVDRFLLRMPRTYLLNIPVERIGRHVPLLAVPVGRSDVRTLSEDGDRPGTYSLTVIAADRPGLLSSIAGALSLAGLSILTAQVFTTQDDVAVDVFEVEGAFESEISEERWREFRSTLRKVLEGRLSLEHRVDQKRAHYPAPRRDLPVEIKIHNDVSDFFTVVEVGCPDRIGLLFDITSTLAELHLDVHLAKVATYGGRVVDAFYVRDELGRKIDDPAQLEEIEQALTTRLSAPRHGVPGPRDRPARLDDAR